MKIYQLIYTNSKHSLSDPELNLKNHAGLGVYSCSQGLTEENVKEIVKFCGYHLPKNCDLGGAKTFGDTNIPDRFPKIFRTFRLSDGKTAALQAVYSGTDENGKQGMFFTHVLIADAGDNIIPERYYKSKSFRKFLTKEEYERELVTYLPVLENADSGRNLTKNIEGFINEHKPQMSVLFEKLLGILSGEKKMHLMIAGSNPNEVDMYILALKYVLPKNIALSFGISTYNVYIPSSSQFKILIHGTVKGKNNITQEHIEEQDSCVYVDIDKMDTSNVNVMSIFDGRLKDLYDSYEEYSINTVDELKGFTELGDMSSVAEISGKLSEVKDKLGTDAFKKQCLALLDDIENPEYDSVRFEMLDIMCSYPDAFADRREEIARKYILCGLELICNGNSVNIEKVFKEKYTKQFGEEIYGELGTIMGMIMNSEADEKNITLILRILAMLKQLTGRRYWNEFFAGNDEYMKSFVQMCAEVMINDTAPVTFTAPQNWTKAELSEVVAYFDSSTVNEPLKNGCRKYILANTDEEWSKFGITLKRTKKDSVESMKDIMRIRELLSQVGYMPFSRTSYRDIKYQVSNEMNKNDNPLMVARLLSAVYVWQSVEAQVGEAKIAAERIYDLIMELKETERSCYDYVFPKLGIEILNSAGHYHEVIINADTMEPEFWNWFLISYLKIRNDEDKRLTYRRVFEASSKYLKNVAVKERIENHMRNDAE